MPLFRRSQPPPERRPEERERERAKRAGRRATAYQRLRAATQRVRPDPQGAPAPPPAPVDPPYDTGAAPGASPRVRVIRRQPVHQRAAPPSASDGQEGDPRPAPPGVDGPPADEPAAFSDPVAGADDPVERYDAPPAPPAGPAGRAPLRPGEAGGRGESLPPAPGLRSPARARRFGRSGGGGAGAGGRPGRPAGGRARRRLLAVSPLLLALAVIWFAWSVFEPLKGHGHGRVDVTIPARSSVSAVGRILERQHVVSSGFFFSVRAFVSGRRGDIRPGHFVLARDMSYGAALKILTAKPVPVRAVSVVVPEGDSRREIAQLAHRDGLSGDYLRATVRSPTLDPRHYGARHSRNLEGFLFPATYELPVGTSVSQLVADQLQSFTRRFKGVDLSYARRKHLSAYDVLTIASMVEREAGVARDRPLVAAVIYNRLKNRMPLGIDATIRYVDENWTRPLSSRELRSRSRYNTRLHRGLPPTPIGNPGLASIQAASHPARVPYLYFVVKPGGRGEHLFSKTYAEFKRDASRYRGARTRNGGHSPTR